MPSNASVHLVLVVREPACHTIATKASLGGRALWPERQLCAYACACGCHVAPCS
jgi:hypothetical protein